MTIFELIEDIANTSSTKTKEQIIRANKDNAVLVGCFYFAENNRLNFYTKFKPEWLDLPFAAKPRDLHHADLLSLNDLDQRKYTGHAAHDYIKSILAPLSRDARIIFGRVVNRDLRCGAGTSIANKVWKDLIPEYPMLLASKYEEKNIAFLKKHEGKKAFIVQNKCDGGRVNIRVDVEGNVVVLSRAGGVLDMYGHFDELKKYPGFVFDGEVLVRTKDGVEDRKTGNGFFTKAVRGTLTAAEAKRFSVVLWDMVPVATVELGVGDVPYESRLGQLSDVITKLNKDHIQIIEGEYADTMAQVEDFYGRMRARGEEGAIIKVAKSVWEDRRSKYIVKMKAVNDADLLCVDVELGQGKFAGMVGALVCETSDGLLKVRIGTGLKDDDRAKDPAYYVGKIIEMQYNEIIEQKDRFTKCMFLPVYVQVRLDKTKANKLEELKLR